jgi:hypothetical protein
MPGAGCPVAKLMESSGCQPVMEAGPGGTTGAVERNMVIHHAIVTQWNRHQVMMPG